MEIKALQLASRFSLPPNSLGYCGKDTAPAKLKKCAITGECNGVEEELTKFIVLHPYLKTISQVINKPLFSYEVVESYWFGNNYLKKFQLKDYDLLLENFAKQGVPDWLVKELQQQKPKKFIPTHLFQVLHVGVGRASGSVPYNIDTINQCMIRWGHVEKIENTNAEINLNSLKKENKKFKLIQKKETVAFDPEFILDLKVGDIVAVHWKQVIKILESGDVVNLNLWTKEVLDSLQS